MNKNKKWPSSSFTEKYIMFLYHHTLNDGSLQQRQSIRQLAAGRLEAGRLNIKGYVYKNEDLFNID